MAVADCRFDLYDLVDIDDSQFASTAVMLERTTHAGLPVRTMPVKNVSPRERYVFAKMQNIDVSVQVQVHYQFALHYQRQRRITVKNLLDFDLHDLAVMVGTGSFVGSVASVSWGLISSNPLPSSLSLILAGAGFVGGRFISEHSRHRHASR